MKRILITGAGSYIGDRLKCYIYVFRPQWQVEVISVRDNDWESKSFESYDVVVNVAGIAHVKETKENEALYYEVNHKLAVKLAQKAKTEGVSQYVFLSSMSVYGLEKGRITKESIPNPTTNYGKSKLMAEKDLWELRTDGFKVALVRPPMVYGEGCKGNYNMLIKFAEKFPLFPKWQNQRSMIYIDTLCEMLVGVMETHGEGIYCPQDKCYVCTSNMVSEIARSKGKKILLVKWLNPFVWVAQRMPGRIGNMANKAFGDLVYELE